MIALGVGAAKTGTHSLAAALGGSFRSGHEPQVKPMLDAVLGHTQGRVSAPGLGERVRSLCEVDGLEVSVSQINGYLVELMVELYPRAWCLLTVRDCRTWLRSFVNHQLSRPLPPDALWTRFRDLRFDLAARPYGPDDAPLERRGLYSLDAYFAYWASHNAKVVRSVRADRLMVIPTLQMTRELPRIGEALGARPETLRAELSHQFRAAYVDSPVDLLDPAYLEAKAEAWTASLWSDTKDLLAPLERNRMAEALGAPAPCRSVAL